MFAPEFEHIEKLVNSGMKFQCGQVENLQKIYVTFKNRYDACKKKFEDLASKKISEIQFLELNDIQKELNGIKMNFENDEAVFKK